MAEKIYAAGIRTFAKHEKAPDFVLGTIIITPEDFIKWMKENPEHMTEYQGKAQLRLQMTKGQDGRVVVAVDTWKPSGQDAPSTYQTGSHKDDPANLPDDQLPF
jgi:hypothetical protein